MPVNYYSRIFELSREIQMTKPVCAVVGIGPQNGAAFARRFASEGVALIIIDGGVKSPELDANAEAPEKLNPEDIAATAYFLSQQPHSAWTFEADVRPSQESW